jgi:pilus assembly protein Flp/PilA
VKNVRRAFCKFEIGSGAFGEMSRGATATEYAMLIIFITLAIAGGATLLGNNINNLFSSLGASISGLMP